LVQRNTGGTYDFEAELYTVEGDSHFTKKLDRRTQRAPSSYGEFVDSILEKRQPIATGEHGLKVMKILDGIYKSVAMGREVCYCVN
jgi:predicted dehydrogenase